MEKSQNFFPAMEDFSPTPLPSPVNIKNKDDNLDDTTACVFEVMPHSSDLGSAISRDKWWQTAAG